uniref:Putative secreted protein n=1 Tax=Amblyomma triste TaxID=251400 RepID=A0A023G4Y7_AMBTT
MARKIILVALTVCAFFVYAYAAPRESVPSMENPRIGSHQTSPQGEDNGDVERAGNGQSSQSSEISEIMPDAIKNDNGEGKGLQERSESANNAAKEPSKAADLAEGREAQSKSFNNPAQKSQEDNLADQPASRSESANNDVTGEKDEAGFF